MTDPAGDITHFRYDGRGDVTSVTDAIGNTTSYIYNLAGQPTSVIYPATGAGAGNAQTVTTYEYVGGPVQKVVVYDENNNSVREVDYTYTPEGQVATVTGSTQPASYTYDGEGRVSTMTDGNGHTTHYDYDAVGNLLDERYPLATSNGFDTDFYTHDKDGNVINEFDGRGVLKTYQRNDPESLVTGIYYSNFSFNGGTAPTAPVSFSYDNFGRQTYMADGVGNTQYIFDALGNVIQEIRNDNNLSGNPPTEYFTYYPDNSIASMEEALIGYGGYNYYNYDSAGRLTQVTTPWGETFAHSYSANGWLQSTVAGGAYTPGGTPITGATTTYGYNQRGFLTSLVNSGNYDLGQNYTVTQGNVSSYSNFTYDALGNRLGFSASIPAISQAPAESYSSVFGYDSGHGFASQNRDVLTQEQRNSAVIGQFSYDPAYNDVSVNADNQIQSNSSIFDGQGNPTTYANTPLLFDAENRLTVINGGEQFAYDGDGHRITKTVNGVTTYYFYCGNKLLGEYQISQNGVRPFGMYYAYAADGLRAVFLPPNDVAAYNIGEYNIGVTYPYLFDFLYDPQGNVVETAGNNEQSGTLFLAGIHGYSAYGSSLLSLSWLASFGAPSAPYLPSGVGFGGQWGYYTDPENGLVLMGARYYDPGQHRFLNRDPIDYKGGSNLYAYCGGNPINNIDPDGTNAAAMVMGGGFASPIIWQLPKVALPEVSGTVLLGIGKASVILWGIESVGELGVYGATGGHLEGPTMRLGETLIASHFPAVQSGIAADPRILTMWQTTVRYYGGLSTAAGYGIDPYNQLKRALNKTGLQAHHIIEQRFAALLGLTAGTMDSVAVTPAEHQVFTNAWRRLIGYGDGTKNASPQDVINAGRVVYKDFPALLNNVNKLAAKLGIP